MKITYVAFLLGINVGGHRKIKMSDLRTLFEKMGFSNVKTVLASGNVIPIANQIATGITARTLFSPWRDELRSVYIRHFR